MNTSLPKARQSSGSSAIRRTALLTVEGERDDICAVGQTVAAHDLCSPFGGGGRKRAAGIDHLSAQGLEAFADALAATFPRPANS